MLCSCAEQALNTFKLQRQYCFKKEQVERDRESTESQNCLSVSGFEVRCALVMGLMRRGFLIFQVRAVGALVHRLACCSVRSSCSTALNPLP